MRLKMKMLCSNRSDGRCKLFPQPFSRSFNSFFQASLYAFIFTFIFFTHYDMIYLALICYFIILLCRFGQDPFIPRSCLEIPFFFVLSMTFVCVFRIVR